MGIFEDMGKGIDRFFGQIDNIFTTKHPNCRSAIIHPIFFDGKPRYMDVIPPESYERYQMRKWLSQVPHGGIVGDYAYLIVYNREAPERSYLIREGL